MAQLSVTGRPSASARRFGYVIAVVINAVLLWLIHGRPGWDAVPFLTPETTQVLGAVDASLAVAIAVDVVQFGWDPRWLVTAGSSVTTAFGLWVMVRMLQVFPFDFGGGSAAWEPVARVLLILGIVGTAVALLVQWVQLIRLLRLRSAGTR
jgi:hypothetical protein